MSEEQLIPTPSVFGENGNFLLERELGRGGMGGVYMGRDKMLDRPVAVKVMLKEYGSDPAFVEKFKKEAQAAAKLIHPNIAQVYSYGISDGMPYIAMELVAGGSLYQLMQNTGAKSDVPRVMKICEQVAQALRCAADQGLVHGDVKPENVLLDANGNAKLVDFGLAAMQTDTNEIWGTPYYIAPEKVKKEHVDYRADMFSLGGTIYHALTGTAPFEGDDANAVVRRRFEGPPLKPSEVRPGLSPQVDYLVLKMLAMDPQDRYPTFEALLDDFKKVMTTGLSMSPAAAAAAGAALGLGGGVATSAGGKRLKFRSRRKLTTERVATPTAGQDEPKDDIPEDVPDIEEAVEEGGRRGRGKSAAKSAGDEDGGGVGGKVAMVVGGVIGLIALVVGALVWYKVADEKARADEEQAQIERGFDKARSSIAKTKNVAIKFADEFDEFANEAIEDCKKPTEELRRILSARYADSVIAMLRPPPSAELMAAIASTNTAKAAEAPAEAKSAEGGNAAAPAPAPVAKSTSPAGMSPAAIEAAVRQAMPFKFRDPTDDEADSASPGHEKYKKEKEAARAKWEAEVKAKVAAASQQVSSAAPAAAAAAAAAGAPSQGKSSEVPGIVKDVNGLWDKAYSCQACAIRIRKAVTELLGDIEEADKIVGDDRQTMNKFIDVANQIKDRFEVIKSSKDVETVQKARGFINDRGKKYVEQTVRRLREEAAQAEREAAAARAAAAEKQRQEELKRQHAEKIAREVEAAKAGFQKVIDNRNLHLLDWDGAKRMLRNIELDTSEGQLQLDLEMNKVEAMEFVHKVMVRNAKGFTFTRGKLRNHTVVECDDKEVTVLKKGATKKQKIDWVKFYRNIEMHTNLNELMNKFVRLGKENGNPKLNLKEWANGMMGIGLTMRIICADDPTAANYGEQTVKDALKLFPHFLKQAKEYFPDLDFSEVAEAAAAENV